MDLAVNVIKSGTGSFQQQKKRTFLSNKELSMLYPEDSHDQNSIDFEKPGQIVKFNHENIRPSTPTKSLKD